MKKTRHSEHSPKQIHTKIIVIISLICSAILLLLSIWIPERSNNNTGTIEQPENTRSATESTTESTTTKEPELFDMGEGEESDKYIIVSDAPIVYEYVNLEDSRTYEIAEAKPGFITINENTYYLTNNGHRFSGWLQINDTCYLFRENGTMVTGWYLTEGHQYYFDENGVMLRSQWVEDKYVGEDGYVLTNTLTPDGIYVGQDGTKNDFVGIENSVEGLAELKLTLEDMVGSYNGTWSVYVKDITRNEYLVINNTQHFSASLIKLYCAAAVYDQIDKGLLEETETVDSLLSQMISVSDNDAFNLLVMKCSETGSHIAGREVIQNYINENGYKDTTITSILVPTKYRAPSSPGRNYTTVVDCGRLLENIYKEKCVSPAVSQQFLELLLNQSHINKIPAGLPEETKCANKTGDTNEVQHDAAIVFSPNGDYILCVMSTGCGAAIPNTVKISKTVYEYFN